MGAGLFQSLSYVCIRLFNKRHNDNIITLLALSHIPVHFDQVLTNYVEFCCDTALPFWRARHAVLGVQCRWRHVRKRIPRSWDAIRSWHL